MINMHLILKEAASLHSSGKFEEALKLYEEIYHFFENDANFLYLIGTCYGDLGFQTKGIVLLNKSVSINGEVPEVYNNMGKFFNDLGEYEKAILHFEKAIKLNPNFSSAYFNLGNSHFGLKQHNKSRECFEISIKLNPNYVEAYNNLGNLLRNLGLLASAVDLYNKAILIDTAYSEAYYNCGIALKDMGRFDEALHKFTSAKKLNPDYKYLDSMILHTKMHLCDWSGVELGFLDFEEKIKNNLTVANPLAVLALTDSLECQYISAKKFTNYAYPSRGVSFLSKTKISEKKIRIGYFSSDFHDHATMHLFAEVLEKHNRNKFEIFGFSFGPFTQDEWQMRTINSFDHFIECCNKSDHEIISHSRKLGIDIAIDLKGYTHECRTGIFSGRAAPIQVSFLGYPGTMGADYIDYLIADEITIPRQNRFFYSEKIAYLPNCYQPNCYSRKISNRLVSKSEFYLPHDSFVFCSFNSNHKITPTIYESWMRILKSTDNSVLWVLVTNQTAEANLRAVALASGVDESRIIFAERLPVEEQLKRMTLADLMLDTYPYGAHTTCSDALRVGLPVLTLMGQSFVSRVASSLLLSMGVPELIAHTLEDYVSIAISLSKDRKSLKSISDRLSENFVRSPLFNSELFVRNLELLYESMNDRYVHGMHIDHIEYLK